MKIFVGNLAFTATEKEVKGIFEAFGLVSDVKIKNKMGQNSRGFGFVTMPDDAQAHAAILGLEGKEFMGRPMNVSMERPKAIKPKKDYKKIKRLKEEAKTIVFEPPTIPEKKTEGENKSSSKTKKFVKNSDSKEWQKRKGRGPSKPWKKKPGGVKKKFRHER